MSFVFAVRESLPARVTGISRHDGVHTFLIIDSRMGHPIPLIAGRPL